MMRGKIIKGIAGFYYVYTELGLAECKAKGIFRKDNLNPLWVMMWKFRLQMKRLWRGILSISCQDTML